jgi:hypothetical protein
MTDNYLTYILLTTVGVLILILLILGSCTDTFKVVGLYKLPTLQSQPTSGLGTAFDLPYGGGLSNIQNSTVSRIRNLRDPVVIQEPSSHELSTNEPSSYELSTYEPSSYESSSEESSSEEIKLFPTLRFFGM